MQARQHGPVPPESDGVLQARRPQEAGGLPRYLQQVLVDRAPRSESAFFEFHAGDPAFSIGFSCKRSDGWHEGSIRHLYPRERCVGSETPGLTLISQGLKGILNQAEEDLPLSAIIDGTPHGMRAGRVVHRHRPDRYRVWHKTDTFKCIRHPGEVTLPDITKELKGNMDKDRFNEIEARCTPAEGSLSCCQPFPDLNRQFECDKRPDHHGTIILFTY